MIAEKLDNYITSLQADERASLLKILKTIEANNPIESTDADELLDIAANEINADSTTLASIAAYAYISRENLTNLLETNTFGDEIGGILKGVLKIPDFNIDKLRYHKVIIMTDADVDGYHIDTLLMTLFYRYMPELIQNGHLYIATPPLYRCKKGKIEEYCYNDQQRMQFLLKYNEGQEQGVYTQRYKGLGEMNPEQLWETTMNPDTRLLKQVSIEDAAGADYVFSMLMGEDVAPRREFIEKNANYANIDA